MLPLLTGEHWLVFLFLSLLLFICNSRKISFLTGPSDLEVEALREDSSVPRHSVAGVFPRSPSFSWQKFSPSCSLFLVLLHELFLQSNTLTFLLEGPRSNKVLSLRCFDSRFLSFFIQALSHNMQVDLVFLGETEKLVDPASSFACQVTRHSSKPRNVLLLLLFYNDQAGNTEIASTVRPRAGLHFFSPVSPPWSVAQMPLTQQQGTWPWVRPACFIVKPFLSSPPRIRTTSPLPSSPTAAEAASVALCFS